MEPPEGYVQEEAGSKSLGSRFRLVFFGEGMGGGPTLVLSDCSRISALGSSMVLGWILHSSLLTALPPPLFPPTRS